MIDPPPASGEPTASHGATVAQRLLSGATLVFIVGMVLRLFWTETDDAFIFFRYGYNLATHGELTYNLGERVNSLTSPLYGLIVAGLQRLPWNILATTKLFALLCYVSTTLFVVRRCRSEPWVAALCFVLTGASPFLVFWTLAGMETAVLALLVTLFVLGVLATLSREDPGFGVLAALFLVAGLATVARYDAVLLILPGAAAVLWRHRSGATALAAALGAMVPLAWLGFCAIYYGDLLPTSFYVKTPRIDLGLMATNALYMFDFAIFSGLLPGAAVTATALIQLPDASTAWSEHWSRLWWAYGSVALAALYGLATVTTHMGYYFRFLVPLVPIGTLLLGDLLLELWARSADRPRLWRLVGSLGAALLVLQLSAFAHVAGARGSLSGARNGEFLGTSAAQMTAFVRMYASPAEVITEHWNRQDRQRPPRISAVGGGSLAYALRDAYIYEMLASYRHGYPSIDPDLSLSDDLKASADYICTLSPAWGAVDEQLPAESTLVKIFETSGRLGGSQQTYAVFFNEDPNPNPLSRRVGGD